jgi:hypothetical protein
MNRIKAPVKKFVDLTKLTGLMKSKVNYNLHFLEEQKQQATISQVTKAFSNLDRFDRWNLNEEVEDLYELLSYVISRGNVERAVEISY